MNPDLDLQSLLQAYRHNETTPRLVLESLWKKIETSDPAIWISRPSWDKVGQQLHALEQQSPDDLPLYGIPFAIKDNIDVQQEPTTCACPAYAYIASESAFIVQRLMAAGAIPVGKTNLDQFATGLVGVRSPYGIPKNAYHEKYTPGGSSSGSAVAVAKGLCSFSLGTDTAGSGRIPASLNHLVGVKPTRGILSTRGVVPACRTLDCPSIFALQATDAAYVLEVLLAYDDQDPYSRKMQPYPMKPVHELVIGVPYDHQLEFFGNDSAAALFQKSLVTLSSMGVELKSINFQPFLDAARLLYEGPWVAERYAVIEELIIQQPDALHPVTRQIIEGAASSRTVDAFRAQYRLAELHRESEKTWDEVDLVITPTAGTHYTVDEVLAEPLLLNSHLGRYTNFMNLLDLCAWAVPAGFLHTGMPWGVTFFAPAFADDQIAALAQSFMMPDSRTPLPEE